MNTPGTFGTSALSTAGVASGPKTPGTITGTFGTFGDMPRFALQRSGRRSKCPQCLKPLVFKRYVDTHTGEMLPDHVGRCNREVNCGYHYRPREYFRAAGIVPTAIDGQRRELPPPPPPFLHQRAEVVQLRAHADRNTLAAYWSERIGRERWDTVAHDYALGTWPRGELAGAAVYWQVDIHGNVRAGHVIAYDPATGKRKGWQSWVHKLTTGKSAEDLNVQQCLYGQHLLKDWPMDAPVGVVEGEKTAVLCAALIPTIRWVAVGGLGQFGIGKLQALTGRRVIVFPDLSEDAKAFRAWKTTAIRIGHLFDQIHVSDLLERMATDADRKAQLDIGDYLFRQEEHASVVVMPPTPVDMPAAITTEAQRLFRRMADNNPALDRLAAIVDLELGHRARVIPNTVTA